MIVFTIVYLVGWVGVLAFLYIKDTKHLLDCWNDTIDAWQASSTAMTAAYETSIRKTTESIEQDYIRIYDANSECLYCFKHRDEGHAEDCKIKDLGK